jgi:hypothetical protein
VLIELTEPLPHPEALNDPVVAADWPEARRERAGKVFANGKPVDFDELRTYLVRLGMQNPRRLDPVEPGISMTQVRIEVARSWGDVRRVLDICGEPEIAIRRVEIVPLAKPKSPVGRDGLKGPKPRPRASNPAVQIAIEHGIDWLTQNRTADGSWRADGSAHEIGVTGLALLAYMGAGYGINRAGPHQMALKNGFK